MEEFEPSSKLGIGNRGVRAKFEVWNRKWRSLSQVPTLGIGNGGVRAKLEAWNRKWRRSGQVPTIAIWNGGVLAKFEAWNREWRSSSQVRGLESEMEEFEPCSDAWNRDWKSSSQVRGLESGMEEFEPSSRLGIGNGGVRVKFRRLVRAFIIQGILSHVLFYFLSRIYLCCMVLKDIVTSFNLHFCSYTLPLLC